jgi:hypothetical protein
MSVRAAFGAVLSAGALLFTASTAQAGLLVQQAGPCATPALSQPFTPWLDYANYTLAPGGRAESDAGWDLDGASIAAGNEPWQVMDGGDASALKLPAWSKATTDAMCVGIDHPTLRFFSRSSGTSPFSSLTVEALVEDNLGLISTLPVAVQLPHSQWSPGSASVILASLLPLLPGDKTPVAFRFRATGPGTWYVDDVLVDPYKKG